MRIVLTCSNKKHIVFFVHGTDTMRDNLCVMHVSFKKQWLATNDTVHQEVVLDKV